MKLLGSTESKITKDKNGENVPHLEVVELVFIYCNLVNNDYQQDSRILYQNTNTFVPNKTFGIRKNIFACLFSVHNTISLSRHEQVCLMRLRFERYFSHHRA